MGTATAHMPVKLFVGLLSRDRGAFRDAERLIKDGMGTLDSESPLFDFTSTDYYAREFGAPLTRKFVSIARLGSPETIFRVKLLTNRYERKLMQGGSRTVNIDPGYLTEGKVVLLTTKDHAHRIYLSKGIFGESTLYFRRNTFVPWATTYPDYRSAGYIRYFNELRARYRAQQAG